MAKLEKSLFIFIITFVVLSLFLSFIAGGCKAEEIDDALINAIIKVESGENPNAYNENINAYNENINAYNEKTQCRGLMQISKIVLKEWNQFHEQELKTGDLYNSKVNITIGTWYLLRLKNHYLKNHYSLENLLACYNWGYENVRKVNFEYNRFPASVKKYIKDVKNGMLN